MLARDKNEDVINVVLDTLYYFRDEIDGDNSQGRVQRWSA